MTLLGLNFLLLHQVSDHTKLNPAKPLNSLLHPGHMTDYTEYKCMLVVRRVSNSYQSLNRDMDIAFVVLLICLYLARLL